MKGRYSFPLFIFSAVSWNERGVFIPAFHIFNGKLEWKSVIHSSFSYFQQQPGMKECYSFPLFTFLSASWNEREWFIPAFHFFISKLEWKSVIHSSFSHNQQQPGMKGHYSFPLFAYSTASRNERALFIPAFHIFNSKPEWKGVIHSSFSYFQQQPGMNINHRCTIAWDLTHVNNAPHSSHFRIIEIHPLLFSSKNPYKH